MGVRWAMVGRWMGACALAGAAMSAHAAVPARVAAALEARLAAAKPVDALVLLDDAVERTQLAAATGLSAGRPALRDAAQYAAVVATRAQLLGALKSDVLLSAADPDLSVLRDYDQLPVLHVRLRSARALERLRADPRVRSVDAIQAFRHQLAQSLPLINQPAAAAGGHVGTGTTVAVLDTGVDYTRAAFGSCASPGGACKVAYAHDFAPDDGQLDANGHGTNVAGIVLGVAPGARVAALDVFNGASGYTNDIIAAINWTIANKATYNIVAINMSLGYGKSTAAVDPNIDSFGQAIRNAVSAGIVVVAASGNDGYTNGISYPAAYSNVVSVGAYYDANMGPIGWSGCSDSSTAAYKITCFSNSASFLTITAPGALITAAGITQGGTSQASPHVAGAAAVLMADFPSETPAEIKARLQLGATLTDHRNGIVKPSLDLQASLGVPPATYRLSVSRAGAGAGTVVSSPSAIDCGSTCTADITNGDSVTLTALHGAGGQFAGWGGACSGSDLSCTLTMSAVRTVTATFVPAPGEEFLPAGGLPSGWATASGANAGWAGATDSVFTGTHALKSAAIGNGQSAGISVSGAFASGVVAFARRVSSASGDALTFAIDGSVQGTWSGEVAWGMVSYPISAGNHTLTWTYTKDGSGSAGSDGAWIDSVYLPYAAATTAEARNDFDGDGRADLMWRHDGTGGNTLWLMNGPVRLDGSGAAPTTADTNWLVVGHADFDGDGRADILWRHVGNGNNALWMMDGIQRLSSATLPATADPAWVVAGIADFDGDGKPDILWRNGATGANALWLMDGTTRRSATLLTTTRDLNWQVVGTADVDGDGKADVVWRNNATGANALWLMDGDTRRSAETLPATADLNWRVVSVTDFDGDGKADLLWRNVATGSNAMWMMDGATRLSSTLLPTTADPAWKIAAVGDFDADGKPDIVWRHSGDGRNAMWTMDGATRKAAYTLPTASDRNWKIVAPRTNPH